MESKLLSSQRIQSSSVHSVGKTIYAFRPISDSSSTLKWSRVRRDDKTLGSSPSINVRGYFNQRSFMRGIFMIEICKMFKIGLHTVNYVSSHPLHSRE